MNVIKVYLSQSGSIASLEKDFPLFQYQYENKLLNVYVPTNLTSPEFVELTNGAITKDYVAGTALKTSISFTNTNGKTYTSRAYYLRYLKTLTQNGVEYALFERKLPKEYTLYAGAGMNAPQMAFNVVNVNNVTVDGVVEKTILNITSSQLCSIDIMPSTSQDIDTALQASEVEEIESNINAILGVLPTKQDKVDEDINNTLESENKSVVGAINNLMDNADMNNGRLDDAEEVIQEFGSRIEKLEGNISTGEYIVGQITRTSLPSDDDLNDYVYQVTGRTKQSGDVIIVIVTSETETDSIYKYFYSQNMWQHYEIQFLQNATNKAKGIVKGNYDPQVIDPETLMFDIKDGVLNNVFYIDAEGEKWDIQYLFDLVEQYHNGKEAIPRARNDANGRNIINTYMTKAEGATKTMLENYALPRIFNDTLYFDLKNDSFVAKKNELPSDVTRKDIDITDIGDQSFGEFIYDIPKVEGVDIDFQLSSKNSTELVLPIGFTNKLDEIYTLRAEVYYQRKLSDDVYSGYTLLGVSTLPINMSTIVPLSITSYKLDVFFSELENDGNIELKSGDRFAYRLYLVVESSQANRASLLSSEIYSATSQLNVSSVVKTILSGDIDAIDLSVGEINATYDDIDGVTLYSTGKITFDNQDTKNISVSQEIPIIASDEIVFDATEDNQHIQAHLHQDITNKLARALTTPMATPSEPKLVAIDTTNSQTMLGIGEGLSIENGVLKASGGSSGGVLVDIWTPQGIGAVSITTSYNSAIGNIISNTDYKVYFIKVYTNEAGFIWIEYVKGGHDQFKTHTTYKLVNSEHRLYMNTFQFNSSNQMRIVSATAKYIKMTLGGTCEAASDTNATIYQVTGMLALK